MKKLLLMCMMALGIIGQAQVQLGSGTSLDSTGEPIPWSNYFKFSYTQQIIKKSDLNTNAGNITGLKFYLASSRTLLNSDQIVVYLGHVSNDTFSLNTSWVPSASLTQVFSGTVTNNSGVVEITFATPFAYNNIDNLVIAIDENKDNYDTGGGTSEYFYKYSVPNNSTLSYRSDTVNPDPSNITLTGTRAGYRSVTQIIGLTPNTPPCTTVSSPAANATGVSITPTITWGLSPSATSYIVSLGTTPGGANILNAVDVGNVTSYSIPTASPLVYQTAYYLTVIPKNITGNASGCTETSFTTRIVPCPTVSAPSSAATGVSLTPTFTWSTVTGATGYRLTVGTTVGGSDILNNFDVGNVLTYVYNTPLNYNTKYYYTVNSYSATSVSASCTERNFTTKTLCPSVTSPASSAMGVSLNPIFTWTANADATGYKISIGTTVGGTDILNNVNLGNVLTYTYNGTALNYNIKYYYTVNAYNGAIESLGCTERDFTTMAFCPVVSFPAANATSTSLTPTISWGAVSNAVGYRLGVGTATGGIDVVNNVDLGNVTSYTFQSPLNLNTAYFYTVNAYTSSATSASCVERKFTTTTVAPPLNDECSGAVVLTVNSDLSCAIKTSGTTVGSTASNETSPSCGASGTNDDVWYKFNATSSVHRIVISNVSATTDMAMAVYGGSCGGLVHVQCSDPNIMDLTGLIIGQEYKVRVWTYASTATTRATFDICVGTLPPPPINDICDNAILASPIIGAPYSATQDATSATNNGGFMLACTTSSVGGMNDGVWYKFVGDGTTYTVSITPTGWDPQLDVYSGACGSFVCVANADVGSSGVLETVQIGTVVGATYYVNVGHYNGTTDNSEGPFSIQISTNGVLGTSETAINKNTIKAYPNPFADVLNISDVKNVKSISIVDIAGRVVKTIEKPSSSLQLRELNSGMYMVILNMNDGSRQTIKAIKK